MARKSEQSSGRGWSLSHQLQKTGVLWQVVAITTLLIFGLAAMAQAQFAGGAGTAESPYLVATATHLNGIRGDYLDKHFSIITNTDKCSALLQHF